MPPAPETASAPSTCSGSSLRSVEPKCSCPSNQSPVRPRPSAASKISPKGEANVVVTTSGSFQNFANIIPRIVQTTPIDPKVTQGSRRAAPRPPPGPGPATATRPHISPAASTNNDPIAGRLQQRHRRRGPGSVFRTLRRPVWRLVRGSEGAGQGATHGRGRSENQARPPPDRSHYSQSSLAIWTALVAAPLRIWSPQHQKVMPRAASGFEMSRRTRPTQIRS